MLCILQTKALGCYDERIKIKPRYQEFSVRWPMRSLGSYPNLLNNVVVLLEQLLYCKNNSHHYFLPFPSCCSSEVRRRHWPAAGCWLAIACGNSYLTSSVQCWPLYIVDHSCRIARIKQHWHIQHLSLQSAHLTIVIKYIESGCLHGVGAALGHARCL